MFLLLVIVALSSGQGVALPDPDGCDETDWESNELFVVVHKEWKPYNSGTIYTCAGSCGSPYRWEFGTNVFPSYECAIKWINRRFAEQPERFIAIHKTTRMQPPKSQTSEHVHVDEKRWKTTKWEL